MPHNHGKTGVAQSSCSISRGIQTHDTDGIKDSKIEIFKKIVKLSSIALAFMDWIWKFKRSGKSLKRLWCFQILWADSHNVLPHGQFNAGDHGDLGMQTSWLAVFHISRSVSWLTLCTSHQFCWLAYILYSTSLKRRTIRTPSLTLTSTCTRLITMSLAAYFLSCLAFYHPPICVWRHMSASNCNVCADAHAVCAYVCERVRMCLEVNWVLSNYCRDRQAYDERSLRW